MPIYEYRCADCGFQEEYLQKVSEPPMTVCPKCGKPSLQKLLSAAGFQLKGSGWYATDFRSSGSRPKAEAKSDTKAEAKEDAKAETKAEAKTETKSESKKTDTPASGGTASS
jgi:putative FmdB family regulatory protein